jgi:hypothetical protein
MLAMRTVAMTAGMGKSCSRNDKKLRGDPGLIAVLHTHARNLDYHPHIHTVMPSIAVDKLNKLVRTKHGKYLFNHKALATVKHELINTFLVVFSQSPQLRRQGKRDHKVITRHLFFQLILNPHLRFMMLAMRTVAMTAGMRNKRLMVTVDTADLHNRAEFFKPEGRGY